MDNQAVVLSTNYFKDDGEPSFMEAKEIFELADGTVLVAIIGFEWSKVADLHAKHLMFVDLNGNEENVACFDFEQQMWLYDEVQAFTKRHIKAYFESAERFYLLGEAV